MSHERIKLEDTPMSIFLKLGEGNPGALRVCTDIYAKGADIDPPGRPVGLGIRAQAENCNR